MSTRDADRNILFGINALQNDFITRDALIAAMNTWSLEKHLPLGDVLVRRNALKPETRALLDQLLDHQLACHGGDVQASLAAMSSIGSLANDLRRSIADVDVLASVASIASHDPYATRATFLPRSASDGVRFRKVREHASGNLGVVYVARDEELHRDVALKEIKEKNADHLYNQAKFLLEAKVTGGLEHPGIVPVYGLGHHLDGRPYYAMRFIRGKSLHDAIKRFHADEPLKKDPGKRLLELQKLLRRFTDVCNAIAYAHSRGILHRDLKPDNVMVGKYGETLVVDWGLAKALGTSSENTSTNIDDDDPLPEASLQPSSTEPVEATQAGSLVGTPAYMSPEQAAGRLDLLGPASDIYGLGATLYHLIVGQPPISGTSLGDVLAKIQSGEIPRPRSFAPWLDPALEAICLKAMALRTVDRYATAKALAEDLDRWIAGEPVQAYREPFSRRARRWARKHRTALTGVFAAAIILTLSLGGFAWLEYDQRRKTDAAALIHINKADDLAIEARFKGEVLFWDKVINEASLAEDRLESGNGSPSLRQEVANRLTAFQAEQGRRFATLEAESRDSRMIKALEEARLLSTNLTDVSFDTEAEIDAYLAAFRTYDIDLASLPVEKAAQRIRSSPIADDLIAALDDWFRSNDLGKVPKTRLDEIARAAETDPLRAAVRDAVSRRDVAALRGFCESSEDRRKLGPRLRTVFNSLIRVDPESSFPLLETIRQEHPNDFWLNEKLGRAYGKAKPPRLDESVRCLSIAVAIKPDSPGAHVNLGVALKDHGKLEQAIEEYRLAIRHKPDYAQAHNDLGNALKVQGKLEPAIDEYRQAIRIKPDYAEAHSNLGLALHDQGKLESSMEEFREAIRIKPDYANAHINLGAALKDQGKLEPAIEEYRQAIRLKPDIAAAHNGFGNALKAQGKLEPAIEEYRQALRIKPNDALAHYNLGITLMAQGKIEMAIEDYGQAIRLKPDYAPAHNGLGYALKAQGKLEPAIEAYRQAIRLKPDYAEAHNHLGYALKDQGKLEPAIEEYREAIRIKPDYAEPYCNLGLALESRGQFQEALKSLERGHELGSSQPGWSNPSEAWVVNARRLVELEAKVPAFLKGEATPQDPKELLALADVCHKTSRHASAVRFATEAFLETPSLGNDLAKGYRYHAASSASMAGTGQGKDDPAPDPAARVKLREKALAWLKADLAAWGKVLDGGNKPARRKALSKTLIHWKEDMNLSGIRDETALAKLPEGEREAFRSLWRDVESLLKRAEDGGSQ
jgi:tetratricopeptide (TPR) repeat protein/tRNA A-37 threonylcarbamoyl transferase component Bud32